MSASKAVTALKRSGSARASIDLEGQVRNRPRRCPACSEPTPTNEFREWLIGGPTSASATIGECNPGGPVSPPAFNEAVFGASHNGYSGNSTGIADRGSIVSQLDAGVRFLEFDINDETYQTDGDFRLGHGEPGKEVDKNPPNPPTTLLRPWLQAVRDWADSHPGHSPITVALDSKADLSMNRAPSSGNLGAVNTILADTLGQRLYIADSLGDSWPSIEAMRGKIVAVLSGGFPALQDESMRIAYFEDRGFAPAIGAEPGGSLIEAHVTERPGALNGDLLYRTGSLVGGTAKWISGGLYPLRVARVAVDRNRLGVVVLVAAQSTSNSETLIFHVVGRVQASGEVAWKTNAFFGPSTINQQVGVRFEGGSDTRVCAYYDAIKRCGTLAPDDTILWDASSTPSSGPSPFYDETDQGVVSVFRERSGVIRYSSPTVASGRVGWDRLAFPEYQKGGRDGGLESGPFWGARAEPFGFGSNLGWFRDALGRGKVVRAWEFDENHVRDWFGRGPAFPATDHPHANWYQQHLRRQCELLYWGNECR